MAKENGNGELTAEKVAKLVSGSVTVPVMKGGKPQFVRDANGKPTGVYQTETVKVAAEHILGFRTAGGEVIATTVDGQKLRGAVA